MKERIAQILKELVACDSISYTEKENKASQYVYDFLKNTPYFKGNPELFGKYDIPNDPYGRFVVYGLVLGKKKDTVLLSGHTDVVSTEVYGEAEPLAFNMGEELEKKLASMDLDETAKKDMESGEWLWGRGVADMKAGIALNMTLTEKYAAEATKGTLEGSVIFMALPDEESYSAGIRSGIEVVKDLKSKYNLNCKLLLCTEPAAEMEDKQVMSLGSVGKVMPVVITQGKVAHVGHCFNGISGLNMLAGVYQKTNGSLEFSDEFEGEATPPPNWSNMRDMKLTYDASLPYRGYGYFTVLNQSTTPEEVISILKKNCIEVFEEEVKKLNGTYQIFKTMNKFETKEKLEYETCVMTFEELCDDLKKKNTKGFKEFYGRIYKEVGEKVVNGALNFPSATVFLMDQVLNFADIKTPLILIGIAPPFYPATHSNSIKGREHFGTKIYKYAKKLSEEKYGQGLVYENYFMGISDNSYTSLEPFDFEKFIKSFPMWGKLYNLNFETIEGLSIPSILYGPVGREYHQWTERVNRHSLFEVMPNTLDAVVKYAWSL